MYLAVAGGKKRRELTPIQSKVRKKWIIDGILAETDARRKGPVCSAGVGGDEKTKLGACEPKTQCKQQPAEKSSSHTRQRTQSFSAT